MKKKLSFLNASTLLITVMLIAIVILPLSISANDDKKTIISFLYTDEGEDTSIAAVYGSTDDLPDMLRAVVLDSDGEEAEEDVSVEWECDGYDPATNGEYRFNSVISDDYQYSGTMPYAIVVVSEGTESDEADAAAYDYTFFSSPETRSFGDGEYLIEPPEGTDISEYFNIVRGFIDKKYPNAAIITKDVSNAYGAMWSKEKVDLTWPFKTEIFIHLGHAENITGIVADGMTFTLHNDPKGTAARGGLGEGLGVYKGRMDAGNDWTDENGTYLRNSLVVEFDTYYNSGFDVEDPIESPHCAVVVPRADKIIETDHKNYFAFDVAQDWVLFKANWKPDDTGGGLLTYTFSGVTKEYRVDNIIDIFDSTEVYWGFTGTTGKLTSLQAAVVKILPTPAVKVEKSVRNAAGTGINGGQASVFDTLTYTIRTTSTGGSCVTPVTITDELPSYVEYAGGNVRVTTNDSKNPSFTVKPSFKGSTMTVDTGHSLEDVGDWIEVSFDVKLNRESSGQVVKNTATVSAHRLIPKKTNTTQVTVAAVKLSATKTARILPGGNVNNGTLESPVSIEVGNEIEYTIAVDSSITIPSTPANKYDMTIITDILPEGLEYVDSTGGGVLSGDGRTVRWNFGELPKGKTTVTLKTRAKAGGTIINTATVAIEGFSTMETNKTYHHAMHPEINLRVKKVIGNIGDYGATNSAAYSELASRPFAISLSGAANGSVTLKHGETSGNMAIVLEQATATINISEIVPMEFSEDYKVSAVITHADGRTETQTGRKIKLQAGDNVTITVTNIFVAKPFFKIWAWSKNKFK